MNPGHQPSGNARTPASGLRNGVSEQNRSTAPQGARRNDFYTIAAELNERQPGMRPGDAFVHFALLAGSHPTIVEFDPKRGLCYIPDATRVAARWITRAAFRRQWNKLKK